MATSEYPVTAHEQRHAGKLWHTGRWIIGGILLLLLIAIAVVSAKWPFTQAKVIADLEAATQSQVTIQHFHPTYFPHPGGVAEGLTFTRPAVAVPPMTVQRVTIQGSYAGLMSRHVPLLLVEGMDATLPKLSGANASLIRPSGTANATLGRLEARNSVLEFLRHDQPPLKFEVEDFTLDGPGTGHPMKYAGRLHIPVPAGKVEIQGELGPWRGDDTMATHISGSYALSNAAMDTIHGLAGTLSSQGKYQGPLRQMTAQGTAKIKNFSVNGGNEDELAAQFQASVNAENGDVDLDHATVQLGRGARSQVTAQGEIAGGPGEEGKTTSLKLAVTQGRIEDFLSLFKHSPGAPMTGDFTFKGNAELRPGRKSFYDALLLSGNFGISQGRFTGPETQSKIEALSEQAEGDPKGVPDSIVTDATGSGVLSGGVAKFTTIACHVPGANAKLHGTYELRDKRVDLRGTIYSDATLAQSTTGVKSFLMKIMGPFIKKNHRGGAMIPVTIKGRYPHWVYTTDPL